MSEQEAVFFILETLARRGEAYARKAAALPPRMLEAASSHSILAANNVSQLRSTTTAQGSLGNASVIRLQPPSHFSDRLVVLWCRWDFSQTPARCGYYYGNWFLLSAPNANSASGPKVLGFLGYRFETPEIGQNHNYYHCQPCLNFGTKDDPPVSHAIERSTYDPTWPIAASNSVELLLCLVLSLYGFDEFRKIEGELMNVRAASRNSRLTTALGAIKALAIKT